MPAKQLGPKKKPRRPQYAAAPISLKPAARTEAAWAYEDEKGIAIYAETEVDGGPYGIHPGVAPIGLITWAQVEKCLAHHRAVRRGRKK